jgi:hypothetical protein
VARTHEETHETHLLGDTYLVFDCITGDSVKIHIQNFDEDFIEFSKTAVYTRFREQVIQHANEQAAKGDGK